MLTKVNTNPNHYAFTHEKNKSLTNFLQIFGLNRKFWRLWSLKLSAVLQTSRQIFADFSHLLSPIRLKTPFLSASLSIYPPIKAIKGLIKQTKWLIYQIQHYMSTTANHPQGGVLWI